MEGAQKNDGGCCQPGGQSARHRRSPRSLFSRRPPAEPVAPSCHPRSDISSQCDTLAPAPPPWPPGWDAAAAAPPFPQPCTTACAEPRCPFFSRGSKLCDFIAHPTSQSLPATASSLAAAQENGERGIEQAGMVGLPAQYLLSRPSVNDVPCLAMLETSPGCMQARACMPACRPRPACLLRPPGRYCRPPFEFESALPPSLPSLASGAPQSYRPINDWSALAWLGHTGDGCLHGPKRREATRFA